jgi:glycosyltransferase involved in cell wall biosynthesis
MAAVQPDISVVVPAHNRPASLARLLAALRVQDLPPERFEVIVVDDGSEPPLSADGDDLALRLVRRERAGGPAAARNSGWRVASAPLVAFTDDDCLPVPGWLSALLETAADPGGEVVIQGPVAPDPNQASDLGPVSHTLAVSGPSHLFVSANVAYSRSLLDRTGGFDESFKRSCGEDVELGARALKAGADVRFAQHALVHHEVRRLGLAGMLRHTLKWTDSVRAVAMHPELHDALIGGVFWKPTHPLLLLAAAGIATRRPLVGAAACVPYLSYYRRMYGGVGALGRVLPVHLAIDICEIGTAVAGSVRHRTLMI